MTVDPRPRLVLRPPPTPYTPSDGMTRALAAVLLALARRSPAAAAPRKGGAA